MLTTESLTFAIALTMGVLRSEAAANVPNVATQTAASERQKNRMRKGKGRAAGVGSVGRLHGEGIGMAFGGVGPGSGGGGSGDASRTPQIESVDYGGPNLDRPCNESSFKH